MIKYLKLFFKRIGKDFAQKELLPLKLLFFIHASTVFVVYPYLTIHMRELGINVEETAIMSAITPVVAILMPPIAGMVADKIGNFKILLAFFSAAGGASALLFLIVPVGRVTISYPKEVVLGLSCQPNSSFVISLYDQYPCTQSPYKTNETILNVEACGFVCKTSGNQNSTEAILSNTDENILQLRNPVTRNTTVTYGLHFIKPEPTGKLPSTHQHLKNNVRFTDSMRKVGKDLFFFPTAKSLNFSCSLEEKRKSFMSYKTYNSKKSENDTYFTCVFGKGQPLHPLLGMQLQTGFTMVSGGQNFSNERMDFIRVNGTPYRSSCKNKFYNSAVVGVQIENPDNCTRAETYFELRGCSPACVATGPRKKFCANEELLVELDTKLTFWSYLSVRVFIGMIGGTAFAMFEGAVIAILREHKADYGLQRIYATVGGMISSPIAGWLIDFASRGKGYTDFRPIFFLYAGLKLVSAFLMLFMNLEFKTPASNVLADVFTVLRDVELITLFIVSFVLGTAWGFIESFLFWLIQDLGGSKSLMGITITVGGVAGIPLLVLSGPIIKKIGHANVLLIGFVFYAIRLLGYSLIYNPWFCLIFEAMESITSSLSFTAAVTYAAKLSTVTTDTSVQGMLGGIYYGVGKGTGSLIGGYSIKIFGMRITYRIFSVATALTGILYFLFNHFYIRRKGEQKENGSEKQQNNAAEADAKTNGVNKSTENIIKDDILPFEDALTNFGYEDDVAVPEEPVKKKVNNQVNNQP